MTTNDGGPAFPRNQSKDEIWLRERGLTQEGMSLRDWFAGQIIGHLAVMQIERGAASHWTMEHACSEAYMFADTMLAVRETTND